MTRRSIFRLFASAVAASAMEVCGMRTVAVKADRLMQVGLLGGEYMEVFAHRMQVVSRPVIRHDIHTEMWDVLQFIGHDGSLNGEVRHDRLEYVRDVSPAAPTSIIIARI